MATKSIDIKFSGGGSSGDTGLSSSLRELSQEISKNNNELAKLGQILTRQSKVNSGEPTTSAERMAKSQMGMERAKSSSVRYGMEYEKAKLSSSPAYRKYNINMSNNETTRKNLEVEKVKLGNSGKRIEVKRVEAEKLNINATTRLTKEKQSLADITGGHKKALKQEQSKQIKVMQKQRNIEISNLREMIGSASGSHKTSLEDRLAEYITGKPSSAKENKSSLGKALFGMSGLLYGGHALGSVLSHSYNAQSGMMQSALSNPISNNYNMTSNLVGSMQQYLSMQEDYNKMRLMGIGTAVGGALGSFGGLMGTAMGAGSGLSIGATIGDVLKAKSSLHRTVLGTVQEGGVSNYMSADKLATTSYYGKKALDNSAIYNPVDPLKRKRNDLFEGYYKSKDMSYRRESERDDIRGNNDIRRALTDPIANAVGVFDKNAKSVDRLATYMEKAQISPSEVPAFMDAYRNLQPNARQFGNLENLSHTWGVQMQNIMERSNMFRAGGYGKDEAMGLAGSSFQRSAGNMSSWENHITGSPLNEYTRNMLYQAVYGVDLEKDYQAGSPHLTSKMRSAQLYAKTKGAKGDVVDMALVGGALGETGYSMQLNKLERRDTITAPSISEAQKVTKEVNEDRIKGAKGEYSPEDIAQKYGELAGNMSGFNLELIDAQKVLTNWTESLNQVLKNQNPATYLMNNYGGNK